MSHVSNTVATTAFIGATPGVAIGSTFAGADIAEAYDSLRNQVDNIEEILIKVFKEENRKLKTLFAEVLGKEKAVKDKWFGTAHDLRNKLRSTVNEWNNERLAWELDKEEREWRYENLTERKDNLKRRLGIVEARNETLRSDLEDLNFVLKGLHKDNEELEKKVTELTKQLEDKKALEENLKETGKLLWGQTKFNNALISRLFTGDLYTQVFKDKKIQDLLIEHIKTKPSKSPVSEE